MSMDRRLMLKGILVGCLCIAFIISLQDDLTLYKITCTFLTGSSLFIILIAIYMDTKKKTKATQTDQAIVSNISLARSESLEDDNDNDSLFSSMLLRHFMDTSLRLEEGDNETF